MKTSSPRHSAPAMRAHRLLRRTGCGITALLVLSGCGSLQLPFKAPTAQTQDEVGTIMVFGQPAVPWAAYKDGLKANFALNAQGALTEVLPVTSTQRDAYNSAFRAQLGIGLPGATNTTTTTKATDAAGVVKTTVNDVTTDSTGTAPAAAGLPTAAAAAAFAGPGDSLKSDPILRYYAAAALNQEVQLLNRYLDSIDKLSSRYDPYVVRIQVALQPLRRDWPYDAYTDLVFSDQPLRDPNPVALTEKEKADFKTESTKTATKVTPGSLLVLPMLVTDSVEAMLHQRSADQLRELGLTLSGVVQGVGVGGNVGEAVRRVEDLFGKDLNSTMTVGRLDTDSIRVRFGAQHQGRQEFAIVPRNHMVTTLVLVPKPVRTKKSTESSFSLMYLRPDKSAGPQQPAADTSLRPRIFLSSSTTFVHAVTGATPLRQSAPRFIEATLEKIKERGAAPAVLTALKKDLPRLIDARLRRDRPAFNDIIAPYCTMAGVDGSMVDDWLWVDLSTWRAKLGISNEELTVVDSPRMPRSNELAAKLERTKDRLNLTIEFGSDSIDNIEDVQLTSSSGLISARLRRIADSGSALIAEYPISAARTEPTTLPQVSLVNTDHDAIMPGVSVQTITGWPKLPKTGQALWRQDKDNKHILVTLPGTDYAQNAVDVSAAITFGTATYSAVEIGSAEGGHVLTARFPVPDGLRLDATAKLELESPDFATPPGSPPNKRTFDLVAGTGPITPPKKTASIALSSIQLARKADLTGKFAFTFEIPQPESPPPPATPKDPEAIIHLKGAIVRNVAASPGATATLEAGYIKLAGEKGFVTVELDAISDDEVSLELSSATLEKPATQGLKVQSTAEKKP